MELNWLYFDVPIEMEHQAKAMRRDRDAQYGNIYKEFSTDERWVGDLGEIVFDNWLKYNKIDDFLWLLEDVAGKADFELFSKYKIGVKTVKRKVKPQINYTAQITAKHAIEPVDYFFFLSYEIAIRRMWLLGGIEKDSFLRQAIYYAEGDFVHPNYQIRNGHEIFNIGLTELTLPNEWLKYVKKRLSKC